MQIIKEKTVSFSGYRTECLIHKIGDEPNLEDIYNKLYTIIERLISAGYDTFISGVTPGFDSMASKIVLKLCDTYCNIKFVASVPFVCQDTNWDYDERAAYVELLWSANNIASASKWPEDSDFRKRCDFMLENSSLLVCFNSGFKGETDYIVRKAGKLGMPIINIAEME